MLLKLIEITYTFIHVYMHVLTDKVYAERWFFKKMKYFVKHDERAQTRFHEIESQTVNDLLVPPLT